MGKNKNMKLIPSLFKNKQFINTTTTTNTTQTWQWPLCKHPKTLSFRADDDVFKMVNSVFFDHIPEESNTPVSGHCFTNSSESASISTESDEHCTMGGESVELIIRGARSERLFFEPGNTSSILMEKVADNTTRGKDDDNDDDDDDDALPFKESVVMAMDSEDPYKDFKKSMEEMVESHGLKDWECLEELLRWYLRMNGKNNHEYIVGAFVDLLVGIASTSTSISCSDSTYSSAASTFSSPSTSPLSSPVLSQKEINEEQAKMVLGFWFTQSDSCPQLKYDCPTRVRLSKSKSPSIRTHI